MRALGEGQVERVDQRTWNTFYYDLMHLAFLFLMEVTATGYHIIVNWN